MHRWWIWRASDSILSCRQEKNIPGVVSHEPLTAPQNTHIRLVSTESWQEQQQQKRKCHRTFRWTTSLFLLSSYFFWQTRCSMHYVSADSLWFVPTFLVFWLYLRVVATGLCFIDDCHMLCNKAVTELFLEPRIIQSCSNPAPLTSPLPSPATASRPTHANTENKNKPNGKSFWISTESAYLLHDPE